MGFKLVEYPKLKENILDSIRSFAQYYHYSSVSEFINFYLAQDVIIEPAKLAEKYKKIPSQRRSQIGFLLTVIHCLDEGSDLLDNKYLLNAASCYVREIISCTYDPQVSWKNYWTSFVTSVDESYFFRLLSTALGITRVNMPSRQESAKMYTALKEFILSMTYKDPNNLARGYIDDNLVSISKPRPFSNQRIEGFIVEDFIKELIVCTAKLEQQGLEDAKDEYQCRYRTTTGMFSPLMSEGKSNRSSVERHASHCSR